MDTRICTGLAATLENIQGAEGKGRGGGGSFHKYVSAKKKKQLKPLNTVLEEGGSIIRGFSRFEGVFETPPPQRGKASNECIDICTIVPSAATTPKDLLTSRRANIL